MSSERDHNSDQTIQTVVLEQLELFTPAGRPAVQNTITVERNFLRFPCFSLSAHADEEEIYLEDEIETSHGKTKIWWKVIPGEKLPGRFAKKLHRSIEKFIHHQPSPITNPIRLGSLREICREVGIKPTGPNIKLVQETLENIVLTGYKAFGCFYLKDQDQFLKTLSEKTVFHLYSRVLYRGQQLPNGYTADAVYLFLDEFYLRSLNAGYTVPIDWNQWGRLKGDIAQRMYEILSLDVFLAFERKVKELQIQEPQLGFKEILEKLPYHLGRISFEKRYRAYCQYFPIVPQFTRWRARQQLASAHAQLAKERYLHRSPNDDKETWKALTGEPQNWRIRYYVGKRALDEYRNAKCRFLEEPKRQSRSSRSLPSARREKAERLPSPSSTPSAVSRQAGAPERAFSAEHLAFIAFLRDQGVKRAEQLVESSPHSIEMLEVIQEDYLRLRRAAADGRFAFKQGEHSWLSWAVTSREYARPKGLVTQREREERERLNVEREKWTRDLAERLQSGEFRYFRHRHGEWMEIIGIYTDSSNISDWHIRYLFGVYEFTALLSQVSREHFISDLSELDDEEEVPF